MREEREARQRARVEQLAREDADRKRLKREAEEERIRLAEEVLAMQVCLGMIEDIGASP